MDEKIGISVVGESDKETEVWVSGVTGGWAHGQVRVKATEFIFIEMAYQVSKLYIYFIWFILTFWFLSVLLLSSIEMSSVYIFIEWMSKNEYCFLTFSSTFEASVTQWRVWLPWMTFYSRRR